MLLFYVIIAVMEICFSLSNFTISSVGYELTQVSLNLHLNFAAINCEFELILGI